METVSEIIGIIFLSIIILVALFSSGLISIVISIFAYPYYLIVVLPQRKKLEKAKMDVQKAEKELADRDRIFKNQSEKFGIKDKVSRDVVDFRYSHLAALVKIGECPAFKSVEDVDNCYEAIKQALRKLEHAQASYNTVKEHLIHLTADKSY